MEYRYSKHSFKWDEESKTFSAKEQFLYTNDTYGYFVSFPNSRRQFFIDDVDSDWFRRFRLKSYDENEYIFESEDGILCKIEKEVTKIY